MFDIFKQFVLNYLKDFYQHDFSWKTHYNRIKKLLSN